MRTIEKLRNLINLKELTLVVLASCYVFSSCNKQTDAKITEINSFANDAKEWFESKIAEQKALVSEKSSNTYINTALRIKGIGERLNWADAVLYKENGTQFLVLKIDEPSNQFQNKKYNGARCVIFYSHNSQNQIQMQIIEILRKNEQNKTSDNITEIVSLCFQNQYFNRRKSVKNVTADIFFYDENYNSIFSYTLLNGTWSKSKNQLNIKKGGTVKKRIISTLNKRITCNCTTWYYVLFTYDTQTGQILDYEILDKWNECSNDEPELPYGDGKEGGSYSNDDTQCLSDFLILKDQLINGGEITSENAGFNISTIDALKKYKNPKWKILKNLTWDLYSQEIGIVKLVDPSTDKWQWESLTHGSINLEGYVSGGTVTCNNAIATPSFVAGAQNVLYAGMSLNFTVTYQPVCDCAVNQVFGAVSKSYTSTSTLWPAKP